MNTRKRRQDGAWVPPASGGGTSTGVMFLRMATQNSFIEGDQAVGLKTTYFLNLNIEELAPHRQWDMASIVEDFERLCAESIPTHRPAQVVQYSQAGSPLVAITPGNTRLYRCASYGSVYSFTNNPAVSQAMAQSTAVAAATTTTTTSTTTTQSSVSPTLAVKPVTGTVKEKQIRITPALLEATRKKNQENGFRRTQSQNSVMANERKDVADSSAKKYAAGLELFDTDPDNYEWLHLIAYSIYGAKSQEAGNLVCGSAEANSAMIAIEEAVKKLSKHYPHGFNINVKANLVENTHLATNIIYTIHTDDFKFSLTFNAHDQYQPHISHMTYIENLIKVFLRKLSPAKRILAASEEPENITPPAAAASFSSLSTLTPPEIDQTIKARRM